MKKAIVFTFILALVLSASAFATQTRTLVMGNNNMIMMDDANVWLFPSRINNYGNIATGEFGSNDFYNLGINWKFGETKPWVLGTYFSTEGGTNPFAYSGRDLFTYSGDFYGSPSSLIYEPSLDNRSFDLLYGRALGGYNFGFGFGYDHSKQAEDTGKSELGFSEYNFSIGITPVSGQWDIAAQIGLGSFTDKNDAGTEVIKPDGYNDIAFQGRYIYKYNQTLTFVPHGQVMFGNRGRTVDTTLTGLRKYKESRTAFELGAGMNYTPVTNVLAVLDFGFQYEKIKVTNNGVEDNVSTTHFPYFRVGLEGEVFSWMDVRFGAINNWEHFKIENDIKDSYFDNSTYLGVGLNFNRLHLDTYMDPQMVLDGFNFISGANDNLNFQVSALYELF